MNKPIQSSGPGFPAGDAAPAESPNSRAGAAPFRCLNSLSEGYSGIVYDANGYRVGTDHLIEADARLIAAAPDLLAALQAVDMWWTKDRGKLTLNFDNEVKRWKSPVGMVWAQVRAAIAKADGADWHPERAPLCADCGKYRADPPSKLCPGCQAYVEHQR
jgi:hypothetical protein